MIQNPIIAGKKLPELMNPAGAENIQSGYEAIDGSGNKIMGALESVQTVTLTPSMSVSLRGYGSAQGDNAYSYFGRNFTKGDVFVSTDGKLILYLEEANSLNWANASPNAISLTSGSPKTFYKIK